MPSIININKKLVTSGKEPMYVIYPKDGVSISDSPFASITKDGNASKADLDIGNIITEIDGNKVTSLEVIKKVLNKK